MDKIRQLIAGLLPHAPFDALSVGVIDFGQQSFQTLEAVKCQQAVLIQEQLGNYFDLASLTKPLTNSLACLLQPKAFTPEMLLCLNHRGGLPAWGLLPLPGWEEQIRSYPVKESETVYSDLGALRVMLDFDAHKMQELCRAVWDKEMLFWLDLPPTAPTFQYGFRRGQPNFGEVHDPNAWVIHQFCSHAGLFSTLRGLCQTLLNYEQQTKFLSVVREDLQQHQRRFAYGWDRVENLELTLAGKGCGKNTFGHLGFTGTSIWIDPDRQLGQVILSNAVKNHWYDKSALNELRRAIGELVWRAPVK